MDLYQWNFLRNKCYVYHKNSAICIYNCLSIFERIQNFSSLAISKKERQERVVFYVYMYDLILYFVTLLNCSLQISWKKVHINLSLIRKVNT